MNILVLDSWLREHLKTKATPVQIAKCLSLSSQSVERLIQSGKDTIYDIEITTNRPDCLSVYGIARELAAILPRFGFPARLAPSKERAIPAVKNSLELKVEISKPSLCPRFTAIIFDQIKIGPSPKVVQQRLEASGIRTLNNVVDISNYLMLELGQPMHTFDYDKVGGAKMILRESKPGEKIITLDRQKRDLLPGVIVIEDGGGRIIDLCGIMGGANSEVDQNTQRVLLFVQTYDPQKIRQACQALAFRSEAAARFEKGIEPEGVMPAIKKAITMFEQNTQGKVASRLIDIYPDPPKEKKVSLSQEKLNQLMGINIKLTEAKTILESLGFSSQLKENQLTALVPFWRDGDISIPEDLIEEIARLYGYHNLPSQLPSGAIPLRKKNPLFAWEDKIKDALKYWGFSETVSYSLVGEQLLQKAKINPALCLKLSNPLTQDLVYLRPSLIPSLLENLANNQELDQEIKIFEMANIYLPQGKTKLPQEKPHLAVGWLGANFSQLKGTLEALLTELGIKEAAFTAYSADFGQAAKIYKGKDCLGIIYQISAVIRQNFSLGQKVIVFDLDLGLLTKYATNAKQYQPIPSYPPLIEDLSFIVPEKTALGKLIKLIESISPLIKKVDFIDSYQDTRTFRITYQSKNKTLTDKEVVKLRKKIISRARTSLGTKLKTEK